MPQARSLRGVYLITPDEPDTGRLIERTRQLLEGIVWLQYRNKQADAALRREQAAALQALCMEREVPLIINDDPALAGETGAAGVHLGEDDGGIDTARSKIGKQAIVGVSCYDQIALASRAVAEGASYVAFGAFFPSRSKANTRHATPDLLDAAAAFSVPRVAIGGITPENARPLVDRPALVSPAGPSGRPR